MFFLYIFNNYFNKYFRFHKDTNVVVQMLQAFQVSELQYPAYTSDYKHGCHCKTGANVSVPMCLGPPSRGQKAPLRIHKSCLLHMSSRTQHTGGIHKAVSCICNSNIQGCSTLGDPHPVLTVSSFPPPLTTENSLKNPCNVICTNK